MRAAYNYSQLSFDSDTQVGAILVQEGNILSFGFNGMPTGMDNNCKLHTGATRWEVLHAEANAILKCAREGVSTKGATLYITLSPCKECAKLILQAGISRVVFCEPYKDESGILFLAQTGIEVDRCEIIQNENKKSKTKKT